MPEGTRAALGGDGRSAPRARRASRTRSHAAAPPDEPGGAAVMGRWGVGT